MSRSSSTPTPSGSWAGALRPRCAPRWSWTPWNRHCGPGAGTAAASWPALIHHTDAGSQLGFTERLAAAGVSTSVGTVGHAYDNALAESVIGLYKTELINRCGPWRTTGQVETATLDYVDWFNHQRLYQICGDIPPAELEAAYYSHNTSLAEAG
jgi:transposase InsO family protein